MADNSIGLVSWPRGPITKSDWDWTHIFSKILVSQPPTGHRYFVKRLASLLSRRLLSIPDCCSLEFKVYLLNVMTTILDYKQINFQKVIAGVNI